MDAHDPVLLARVRDALLAADHVTPHTDADGLAAGALVLRARGEDARAAVLLDRTQTPWGEAPDLPHGSVALLDQGLRPFARPGVIVDHHVPEGDPGVLALSSFGETPEVPTAPLVRRALGAPAPAWLAAVGAAGDLGTRGHGGAIQKLVPLLNAPRRLAAGPVRTALALLVEHDSPQDALLDPRIRVLDCDLRGLLRDALPDPREGHVGNGHPRATGGSLPPDEFERLLEGLAATTGAMSAAA